MKFIVSIFDKIIFKKINRGLFIVDKKNGVTSHDEVFKLRKNLTKSFDKKIKTGHSGTLDPKVTGVLVLGSGKGTKVLEYILLSKKQYLAEFLFHKKVEKKRFEKSIKKFLGKIDQLPPIKSSVKRETRQREVYDLSILNFSDDGRYARVFCSVERGTYIRKLAHDIGQDMGVVTSMGELERIRAGVFSKKNSRMISTNKLEDILEDFSECKYCLIKKIVHFFILNFYVYGIEELFLRLQKEKKMKIIYVKRKSLRYIKAGNAARVKNILKKGRASFKKGEEVSIFYKNIFSFFSAGKVLATGVFQEDFSFENNLDPEREIIKMRKIF